MQSKTASEPRVGMALLDRMGAAGCEQVVFCHDSGSGLRSIIAIHDTTLGPALGGVRMWPYASEDEALEDCLRLARSMTYKAAAAGVNFGGGKSVIIGDPHRDKTEALLRAHGRFIQSLGGRYIPAVDVGTDMADLETIGVEAERVTCVKGDPSHATALGVLAAIRACMREVFGSSTLQGRTTVVQGAGNSGAALVGLLRDAGAEVLVSDLLPERAERVAALHGARAIACADALSTECDVFAPCALGGVVSAETVPQMRCRIVAGAANNVLAGAECGELLHERGILYAPDFVANAGGMIFIEEEFLRHGEERAHRRVLGIEQAMERVLARSRADGVDTTVAADRIAEERLTSLRRVGPAYVSRSEVRS